ncbi:MAG: 16S rRNA (guanine(527)-N(7))-methyltransferase RsmG [Planctomycetota bacterium]
MSSDLAAFIAALKTAVAPWRLQLSAEQVRAMSDHFLRMVEANRTMNLTRITDPAEAAVMHYADSLSVAAWAASRGIAVGTILDIGTGAGFPAVPLAIAHPDWAVTAIDGTRKKIDFLAVFASEAGLKNLHLGHAHADHWSSPGTFDCVCSRAVAWSAKFVEAAARFVRPGGWLIRFATQRGSSDRVHPETPSPDPLPQRGQGVTGCASFGDAKSAAGRIGWSAEPAFPYEIPCGGERIRRCLGVIRKAR